MLFKTNYLYHWISWIIKINITRVMAHARLTLPSKESRSAVPLNTDSAGPRDSVEASRSASGVVTVFASPSTVALSSYSLLKTSSCRSSSVFRAGPTSPFWYRQEIQMKRDRLHATCMDTFPNTHVHYKTAFGSIKLNIAKCKWTLI